MDPDTITQFCAVTSAEPRAAERYLAFAAGDLDTAVTMFFETGGELPAETITGSNVSSAGHDRQPIDIDDEDDEAMARRLAQEWQGSQQQEVRAPIAPTRQVLQDDMGFDPFDAGPSFIQRPGNGVRSQPRGVFNQAPPSVWEEFDDDRTLLETTGGASAQSSKSSRLARLFQPPFDIMSIVDFDEAKQEARASQKWIMVNLQDNSDFASQTLNRDLWKDKTVKSVIKESFIFLQYTLDSDDGAQYRQFYPVDKYPHISIVDPRTGERVKIWSEVIPAMEFVSEVTDFLDRFSLDATQQNPVQKKARPMTKPVELMSEEDQLNAAIMASVGGKMEDNRETEDTQEMEEVSEEPTIVDSIPSTYKDEPPAAPGVTRLQVRFAASRSVRRFQLTDTVTELYAFVKNGVPEVKGKQFKVIFNRIDLSCKLNETIAAAGLANASVFVEVDE